ncbi:hypothetical protein ACE1ET_15170 [Saccharicrinis sp. FJH62]|uniref:hypothetical protein n=1 Tax=Saccharicrinis sp. FJH62 TaxID=3344657 RepID=UPI0035D4BEDC
MLNNLNIANSLLNDLDDDDIREIHKDYILSKEYNFNYVIDADEIVDFCWPLRNDVDKDIGVIADEQFILEFLFLAKNIKVYFLNDYFNELINIRAFLLSTLNNQYTKDNIDKYIDVLQYYIENLDKNVENNDLFVKLVIQSYSFLLSISEGTIGNDIKTFNDLMASPNINFEGKIKDLKINNYLEQYKKDLKLINKLYDFLQSKRKSKFHDINAVLKTYHLTKTSISNNEKELFFFLSSSTMEVKSLRNTIFENRYENSFNINKLPHSYSLIRSKKQIFAYLIYNLFGKDSFSSENKPDTIESFDRFFKTFKESIHGFNEHIIDKKESDRNFMLVNMLKESKFANREIIENLTIRYAERKYLNKIDEKNKIKVEAIQRLFHYRPNQNEKNNLVLIFNNLLDKVNDVISSKFSTISIFQEYKDIKNFVTHSLLEMNVFDEFLNKLESSISEVELDRGADPVESTFSAFPALFEYNFYKNILLPLLLKVKNETFGSSSELTKFINLKGNIEDLSKSNLLPYILYILTLVKYKSSGRGYSNNFLAYKYSQDLIKEKSQSIHAKKSEITDDNSSGNFNLFKLEQELADIYAIACWAARRSRKYVFAYDLSKEAQNIFPNDPRFDFSLALIGYCWKYEYEKLLRYEISYSEYFSETGKGSILDYGNNAIEKFRKIKGYNTLEHLKFSFIAVLNFQAFCYVAKYKEVFEIRNSQSGRIRLRGKKQQEFLLYSRQFMEELKQLFDITDNSEKRIKLQNFPEYIHTETFLDYYEIQNDLFFNRNFNLEKKLSCAIEDINLAIKNSTNRVGLRKRCIHLLNNLKNV